MYIYEYHCGGMYITDEPVDADELYCEECGDSDMLIGQADTKEEARELLKDYAEDYAPEFLERIANAIEDF